MTQAPQPLPSLETMISVCREARDEVMRDARRDPQLCNLRWRVSRSPLLFAIDANGQRLNDCGSNWHGRKSEVEALLARYPDAVEVLVDSGINFAESKVAYEGSDYWPQFWQATVWRRDTPVYSAGELDALLRRRSGFASFEDMFKASPSYRPSCDVSDPEMRAIADHYDQLAAARRDDRRSYRYGERVGAVADKTADFDDFGGPSP